MPLFNRNLTKVAGCDGSNVSLSVWPIHNAGCLVREEKEATVKRQSEQECCSLGRNMWSRAKNQCENQWEDPTE